MKGIATKKALKIIRDHNITNGGQFAHLMWPKSEGWSTSKNGGHGSQRGKGMWLAGGSFLGRLKKAGLITGANGHDHFLTDKGRGILEAGDDVYN